MSLFERANINCLGEILEFVHWSSVGPLLEAYPHLKEHVLIFRDPTNESHFFEIEDVKVVTEYPDNIRVVDGCEILLVLLELDAQSTINMDRLGGVATIVHYLALPEDRTGLLFTCAYTRALRRGIQIIERPERIDYSGFVERGTVGKAGSIHGRPGCFRISGTARVKNIYLQHQVKTMVIELPESEEPCLIKGLYMSDYIRRLIIYYHGKLPKFQDVRFMTPDEQQREPCKDPTRLLALIDLDSETFNHFSSKPKEVPRVDSRYDLVFFSLFTSIHLSVPLPWAMVRDLYAAGCHNLSLVNTASEPDIDAHRKRTYALRSIQRFRYSSKSRNVKFPGFVMDSHRLDSVFLRTMDDEFEVEDLQTMGVLFSDRVSVHSYASCQEDGGHPDLPLVQHPLRRPENQVVEMVEDLQGRFNEVQGFYRAWLERQRHARAQEGRGHV